MAYQQSIFGSSGSNNSALSGMFGTGGGSMGNTQAMQSNQITPMNIQVQQNPDMQNLINEQKKYQGQMAKGNDIDAINSLRRQQEMMAGNMRMYGAGAGARGFGAGSGVADIGRARIASQSGRNQTGLNAGLASDARQQQRGMFMERGSNIGKQADITSGQQNFALNQWQAQNQASLANSQMAEQQQQNSFNNQMSMAQFYTGL